MGAWGGGGGAQPRHLPNLLAPCSGLVVTQLRASLQLTAASTPAPGSSFLSHPRRGPLGLCLHRSDLGGWRGSAALLARGRCPERLRKEGAMDTCAGACTRDERRWGDCTQAPCPVNAYAGGGGGCVCLRPSDDVRPTVGRLSAKRQVWKAGSRGLVSTQPTHGQESERGHLPAPAAWAPVGACPSEAGERPHPGTPPPLLLRVQALMGPPRGLRSLLHASVRAHPGAAVPDPGPGLWTGSGGVCQHPTEARAAALG